MKKIIAPAQRVTLPLLTIVSTATIGHRIRERVWQHLSSIGEDGYSDDHGQAVRHGTPAQIVIHSLGRRASHHQGGLVTPMPRLQPAAAQGRIRAEVRRLSVRSLYLHSMTIYVLSGRYW